jgi:uncharacterized MAPEG superfamily protein
MDFWRLPTISTLRRSPVPSWGKRSDRTYLNAVESFAPFAALVIIAHVAGKPMR